jgi:predicted phosphodiesterase
MRVAVVSDIHGNLVALEAVIADLATVSPDLVLQGGDLAVTGPRPAEVVDRVRELRWPGVVGNTDELLWVPDQLEQRSAGAPKLRPWLEILFNVLGPWAAERLGDDRLAWLKTLPPTHQVDDLQLLHASPGDLWRAPMPDSSDEKLETTFGGRGAAIAVYGHIHRPFVRELADLVVANSGSVGMPWDGDWRASYLLIEDGSVAIRRVEYDLARAEADAASSGFPLPLWLAGIQREGRFAVPGPQEG